MFLVLLTTWSLEEFPDNFSQLSMLAVRELRQIKVITEIWMDILEISFSKYSYTKIK